jgi:hypothetical protein
MTKCCLITKEFTLFAAESLFLYRLLLMLKVKKVFSGGIVGDLARRQKV